MPFAAFKDAFTNHFHLRGKLQDISSGFINYRDRLSLEDHQLSDDYIDFDFSSKKVNYNCFIDVIKTYIKEFDAYLVTAYPEDWIYIQKEIDWEVKSKLNSRKDLKRFPPILYMDNLLIGRVFNIDPLDLCVKFKEFANNVEILENGILVDVYEKYVSAQQVVDLNVRIEEIMQVPFPILGK